MQELMQKYHSLYIRILSRYSNTCVTERTYKLTKYLFQPYLRTYIYTCMHIYYMWIYIHIHVAMCTVYDAYTYICMR